MQSSQAIQHLSPGKHRKISAPWIYNGILNTQPAAPNTSTYPHRCCLFPPCKNKHSHDKGWAWWWKAVELYICFLMGYFQNFSLFSPVFYPNKVIPASLPHFFCIFFHLILSFAVYFLKTHTHTHTHTHFASDQFNSCTLHVFTSPPPVIRWERRWGVCHHPLCSEGESVEPCVCMWCVYVCACGVLGGGEWLQRGSGPGWTTFWKGSGSSKREEKLYLWSFRFNWVSRTTQRQWYNLV